MRGAQLSGGRTMSGSHTCLGSQGSSIRGQQLAFSRRAQTNKAPFTFLVESVATAKAKPAKPPAKGERFRLSNLAPQPGSRHKELRKGRGYGAGQGGSCGFGMRGQNSRSGPGTRPGFEGGQMPLYRRVPKLKGICGGNSAAIPKYVTVNLGQLSVFKESEEVSLASLTAKNILNISGKQSKLPLKILGDGELASPLVIKAEVFSTSAVEKISKVGGKMVETPKKIKWTRKIGKARIAVKAAAAAEAPAAKAPAAKARAAKASADTPRKKKSKRYLKKMSQRLS